VRTIVIHQLESICTPDIASNNYSMQHGIYPSYCVPPVGSLTLSMRTAEFGEVGVDDALIKTQDANVSAPPR